MLAQGGCADMCDDTSQAFARNRYCTHSSTGAPSDTNSRVVSSGAQGNNTKTQYDNDPTGVPDAAAGALDVGFGTIVLAVVAAAVCA